MWSDTALTLFPSLDSFNWPSASARARTYQVPVAVPGGMVRRDRRRARCAGRKTGTDRKPIGVSPAS